MLSAIEILVLHYSEGLNVQKGLQQSFWRDQYAVSPTKILSDLRKKGYIMVSEDLEKVLVTYTGKELKTAAEKYGVPKSGTKAEVSSRIVSQVPKEEIIKDFPTQIYELTELGRETLKENDYVVYVHKNSNYDSINLYDAEKVKKQNGDFNGVQIISNLYDKAVKKSIKENNYHGAAFNDLSHGNFLSREGMNEFALKYILRAIYVRMSGLNRVIHLESLGYPTYFTVDQYTEFARVDSYMLTDLKKILMALNYSSEEAADYFEDNVINKTRLPAQILTDEEMKLILFLELSENYGEVEQFYRKIAKRPPIINRNKSNSKKRHSSSKQISSKAKPEKKGFLQRLLGK